MLPVTQNLLFCFLDISQYSQEPIYIWLGKGGPNF